MTEQPSEDYEDVYPLLGAIGPYLNFTTGHMNPIDEDEEVVYPEDTAEEPENEEYYDPDADADIDYWEDEEE